MRRPPYTKWLRDCDAGWLQLEDWFPGCRTAWDEHRGVWPVVFRADPHGLVAEDMRCWGDLHRRGCECRTWDGTTWDRWITPPVPREASGDPDAAVALGSKAGTACGRCGQPVDGRGLCPNATPPVPDDDLAYPGCSSCGEPYDACRCGP